MCECECVCVSNTTKLQRNDMLKCPFLWLETGSFTETGKRLIVIVYEYLRGLSMVLLFSLVDSRWRECVAAAKKFGKKERVAAARKFRKKEQGCLKTYL